MLGTLLFFSGATCLLDFVYHYNLLIFPRVIQARNSAIVEKLRDAFRCQSRSPNMIPFDMLGMVSY